MLRKLIALTVVFGVALADPVAKLSSVTTDDLDLTPFRAPAPVPAPIEKSSLQLERLIPEGTSVLLEAVNAFVGYKFTALGLGVLVIEWLISNALVLVIGAAAAVGLCKITGKCNLNYEAYLPVSQLKSYMTPEYVETAEKFFLSAMEKYAEKKARAAQNPWWLK